MLPFTQSSLTKLEEFFKEQGYRVRYEKGSFRTGACMLQTTKVVVVNKFSNLEIKIQSLWNILLDIEIDSEAISEKLLPIYEEVLKSKIIA
ncbi:galactitol-specific phosphotransferase system IIB component [Sphingobacterium zeae]|uniref:Galactitol-specific phosphotransferase system IIB component n=1 Tax=Sphingobacterium zeae TaxID=1776859 RepID=A0ABU0U4S7_9SPHI|nr:galactitol-specific phosphotransferase system IIB component [Sphingobacterium zeae]